MDGKNAGEPFLRKKVPPHPFQKPFRTGTEIKFYFTMKQVAMSCVIFTPRSTMRLKTAFSHAPCAQ